MSATAGCLRDIMETDIMDYMHVDHPYNEKEIWKAPKGNSPFAASSLDALAA